MLGARTMLFALPDKTDYTNRWTMNPYIFDNTYFKEVLLGDKSRYLKTDGERLLLSDREMKGFVE